VGPRKSPGEHPVGGSVIAGGLGEKQVPRLHALDPNEKVEKMGPVTQEMDSKRMD
jgi:hypothetical protein